MSLINLKNIASCSSEDEVHCANNLLKPEQYKKWLSSSTSKNERITCIVELEKPSFISYVDIGNDGSAFVELSVSQSSLSKPDEWTVLLPRTTFMTTTESRLNKKRNQVKSFTSSNLNKTCLNVQWDRLKIICEQKFNRSNQYGLSFIKLYSPVDEKSETETLNKSLANIGDEDEIEEEQQKIGSFFAQNQIEKKSKSITDAIEKSQLPSVADELLSKKSINNNQSPTSMKKDVQVNKNETNEKSQLMKNIVFVLSGFLNPLRSELRNKATAMGATYMDDWNDKCTHLVCAFPDTPKFIQVQKLGKGSIVNRQWILDCYKQSQLLPDKLYELKAAKGNETKQETSKQDTKPVTPKRTPETQKATPKRQSKAKKETLEEKAEIKTKDVETVVDSKDSKTNSSSKRKSTKKNEAEMKKLKIEELPDFFNGIHFYISYGDYDDKTLLDIARVILAYDGIIEKNINSNVKYVITNRMWNQDFAKISKSNPDINFINLDWLQDCHDQNQFLPIQPYVIVP